jgi:hypothetical protein
MQKINRNKVTGEPELSLRLEMETMPEAIRRISDVRLRKDDKFITLLENKPPANAPKKELQAFKDEVRAYRNKVRQEVAQEVEEQSSKDFAASIAMTNYATYNLIEKNRVESLIRLSKLFLNDKLENTFDKSDLYKGAVTTALEAIDHALYTKFYNVSDKNPALAFDKKKRQQMKEILEGEDIEVEDGMTDESLVKAITSYTRTLFLGWGVHTALKNIGQAGFSNFIKAVDSPHFNLKDLMSSYADIMLKKNRAIMENLYVYGDLAYMHEKQLVYEESNWRRYVKPMYINSAAEKFNQGSVAIAIMKNIEVSDGTETISLFEAINEDATLDSKWVSEEFNGSGMELLANVVNGRIRPINMQASGDYHSKFTAEKSLLGSMTTMFTKFLPEMVMDRFAARHRDRRLQEDVQGRFRGLANVVLSKFTGDEVDELDKRGALASLTEIALASLFRAAFLLVGKMACNTPQCKEQRGIIIYALNTMNQLTDDFAMFVSPGTMIRKAKSPYAIVMFLEKAFIAGNDVASWVLPGGDKGEYKVSGDGYKKGDIRFLRSAGTIVPFYSNNIKRIGSMSKKLRNDATLAGWIED